jgi:hypothetical protein
MEATVIIIRGTYRKKPATVTFTYIGRRIWCATIEWDGRTRDVRSKKNTGLRPCPTHAGYLLEQHFPQPKRKRKAVNLSRERERRQGRPTVRSTAQFHPRITVYNGEGNEDLTA